MHPAPLLFNAKMSLSARIKLHRFQAFKDVRRLRILQFAGFRLKTLTDVDSMQLPVFTRRHCDIKSASEAASTVSSPPGALCGCSSLPTPTDVDMNRSIPTSDPTYPFDKASSTAICRERGLAIAASFAALPLPNTAGAVLAPGEPAYLSDTSNILAPRTMPAFACCAVSHHSLLRSLRHTLTRATRPTDAVLVLAAHAFLRERTRRVQSRGCRLDDRAVAGGTREHTSHSRELCPVLRGAGWYVRYAGFLADFYDPCTTSDSLFRTADVLEASNQFAGMSGWM